MGVSGGWHHLTTRRHWRKLQRSYRRWVRSTDAKEPAMYYSHPPWLTIQTPQYYTRRREFLARRTRMDDGIRKHNKKATTNLPPVWMPPLWRRMDWRSQKCEAPHTYGNPNDANICVECKAPLSNPKWTESRCIPCWERTQRRHQHGCTCNFKHKPGCVGHVGLRLIQGKMRWR
jgi:hypothetical protein